MRRSKACPNLEVGRGVQGLGQQGRVPQSPGSERAPLPGRLRTRDPEITSRHPARPRRPGKWKVPVEVHAPGVPPQLVKRSVPVHRPRPRVGIRIEHGTDPQPSPLDRPRTKHRERGLHSDELDSMNARSDLQQALPVPDLDRQQRASLGGSPVLRHPAEAAGLVEHGLQRSVGRDTRRLPRSATIRPCPLSQPRTNSSRADALAGRCLGDL